jgi:hypothetical protein
MRWFVWKRPDQDREQLQDDQRLRAEKEAGLAETEEQWPEVREIARELARHRKENRFSERIMRAVKES